MNTIIPNTITPSRILPKIEFTTIFNNLNPEQKEIIITFIYCSLQSCILNADNRISKEGNPDRYSDIMIWKWSSINMPDHLLYDELPERSDEQILLGISPNYRTFYPARFLSNNNSPYFLKLVEIYINSTQIEKIAILQFLQNRKSESDTIQIHTLTQVSSITQ